jgi:hypothetical protein
MIGGVTDEESGADLAYKWTIRALYASAIALNVWMLWNAADETEVEQIRSRLRAMRDRVMRPVHEKKAFQRAANHVVFEAITIVDEANPKEAEADG